MFALVLFAVVALLALAPRATPRVVRRGKTSPAGPASAGDNSLKLTYPPAGLPAGLAGGGG